MSEREKRRLLDELKEYTNSDAYPLHMPGHKRQKDCRPMSDMGNPFAIDITEIEGFDNLHHANGILKDCMDAASECYTVKKTYFLVNGSSAGILAGISACTAPDTYFLMARNCHKSAYHAVFLRNLKAEYLYPQILEKLGIQGGICAESVDISLRKMKEKGKQVSAVCMVSPTYDGMVSDIRSIAKTVHQHGALLIVDEAHGAHFPFSDHFPESAISQGADLVIQSLHKTLPSLTQTAVLHVCSDRVNIELLEYFLQIYQSSSPSYVLMAAIDMCIAYMKTDGKRKLEDLSQNLDWFYEKTKNLKKIQVLDAKNEAICGKYGIVDIDPSKILISAAPAGKNGVWLADQLRNRFHLEVEMEQEQYVLALMTLMDGREGLERLNTALQILDKEEDNTENRMDFKKENVWCSTKQQELLFQEQNPLSAPFTIQEAVYHKKEYMTWKESIGKIAGEFVYVYPPGIPILVPGERISKYTVEKIESILDSGLQLQGVRDQTGAGIQVLSKMQNGSSQNEIV